MEKFRYFGPQLKISTKYCSGAYFLADVHFDLERFLSKVLPTGSGATSST